VRATVAIAPPLPNPPMYDGGVHAWPVPMSNGPGDKGWSHARRGYGEKPPGGASNRPAHPQSVVGGAGTEGKSSP
jgi:hypothetical protein